MMTSMMMTMMMMMIVRLPVRRMIIVMISTNGLRVTMTMLRIKMVSIIIIK